MEILLLNHFTKYPQFTLAFHVLKEFTVNTWELAHTNWLLPDFHLYQKFIFFVHICVCSLIPKNIRIFIDFEGPIIDDNSLTQHAPHPLL